MGAKRGWMSVLLICAMFMVAAFASMPVPAEEEEGRDVVPATVNKVVLCELFTKSTCGACQSADGAMDRLSDNTEYFPDRVAIIEWHVGPGGTGGDAYTTPAHNVRKSYYGGIPSIPRAVFDGLLWHAGGTITGANDTYNDIQYKMRIDSRPDTTQVKIEVKKSLTASGDAGTYNITVSALDTVLNTTLHLRVLLVEDGNETVKNAKFRYTPKEWLDDVPITLQSAGDKVYLNNTFTSSYDMYKISLVVFVQDDTTKEVLQAQTSLFTGNLGPQLLVESLDFNMLEDTVDSHLDLDDVFYDPEDEKMFFTIQSISEVSNMNYHKDPDNVVTFTPDANWFGEELFKVIADDTYNKNQRTGHAFTVTVDPVNDAPWVKGPVKDFSMLEGSVDQHIDLSEVFEDVEGQTLTYWATGYEKINVTVSSTSGSVVIVAADGVFNITEELVFHASDGELEGVEEVSITVKDVNHGPGFVGHIEDFDIDEDTVDESIDLDDVFFDFDEDPLLFEVSGNNYMDITIGPTENTVRIEPHPNWHGEEFITISASDNIAEPILEEFVVTVNPINDAPEVVDELEKLELDEDTVLETDDSLAFVFYDADLDPLTFDVVEPENLEVMINEDGTIVITPDENWNGLEDVIFTATDGVETTGYKVTVDVVPINDPVLIESTVPDNDKVVMDEDSDKTFSVVATDIDGDELMYFWYIDGKLVKDEIEGDSMVFSPDHLGAGDYEVRVIISDGPSEVDNVWSVKVQDVNRKPVVIMTSPGLNSTYKANRPIEFSALITDEDEGETLTITWSVDGKPIPNSNKASLTHVLTGGTHTIKVTASDGKEVGTDEITIKVKNKETNNVPGFEGVVLLFALIVGMVMVGRVGRVGRPGRRR